MATVAADRRQPSVEEDVISIDSASATVSNLIDANTGQPMLSKKAIHQRDADENLFLRFLELDPPPSDVCSASGGGGAAAGTGAVGVGASVSGAVGTGSLICSGTNNSIQQRRMSTFKPLLGRTPFTITKKLSRTADKGFGFSIVWTHPPRVEKVEPGLSADRNAITPGDYVIFVDKHNVVTMPEADVLNLIRSQGNSLILEIFRRSATIAQVPALSTARSSMVVTNGNGFSKSRVASVASNYTAEEMSPSPALKLSIGFGGAPRSSTACSNASIEVTKRRLNLPQVTFSKESIAPCQGVEDQRRRFLLQLISREQNFVGALQFGMQRFVTPLLERKNLISPNDHRTLFQNIDELIRISEDILEQLIQDDHQSHLSFASRVYLSKTTAICAAYKKYCNGIKRADCVLVNKSRQPGSEFVTFITEPQVPRKRPDLTMFIHRPLQHFREILKLMQLLASHCRLDSEEHKNFTSVINELQAAYREITVGGGLMEPLGEGRPLLTLQDLESRMVFTRCKPFTLAVSGRQWIFGGDLSRVEGRSIKPYWTLLFSDILLFAKVSRDRVLFITEEPLPIANIVDSCFNIRKKSAEFRITIDPNGRAAESPTAYCAPDLTRTPKKNFRRKRLLLRAPSLELKAVWQNLLQRQIFLVNAALGSTPLSSPLDSPDVLNTLVPLSDIGATTTSMASIKLSSLDSINMKNQHQHRPINASHQIEQLIDEKCRILNKTGTPKGSALHLANWMKGQLDKQQEQARLAAATVAAESADSLENSENSEDEYVSEQMNDEEERITFWTREQLEKRTKELNLAKENGNLKILSGKRLSGVEEVGFSETEDDLKSPSRSTTSDSQITVRSSPIVDKLSVCHHCHKNCKQKLLPSPSLLSNSLKVQHSQATSPNRFCQLFNPSVIKSSSSSAGHLNSYTSSKDIHNASKSAIVKKSSSSTRTTPSSIISPTLIENAINNCCNNADYKKQYDQCQIININNLNNNNNLNLVCNSPTTNKLLNGNLSSSSDDGHETTMTDTTKIIYSTQSTTTTTPSLKQSKKLQQYETSPTKQFIQCNCKCNPEDFQQLSPDEMKFETCKLIEDVTTISSTTSLTPTRRRNEIFNKNSHGNCKCLCKNNDEDQQYQLNNLDDNIKLQEDLSLALIGLAQFNPAMKIINSDGFVPTISVVPPSPDAILSKTITNIWDNTLTPVLPSDRTTVIINSSPKLMTINNIPRQAIIENIPEDSPDDSPQDDDPPYRSLNTQITTSLKRYGTLSSLEKFPSEEEELEGNDCSSGGDEIDRIGGDDIDNNGENNDKNYDDNDDDIEVITREVFTHNQQQATLRNWTARAGSYVVEKMSFFEESRAFIDKYLGRWNQEQCVEGSQGDELDECTSGATSGEEIWGTPTSGGGNDDDMQMINSDHSPSSPTKSSSSLNGDDDTELMMDELLMAPPMTASTIRGLLPRRRLEPLFEEETESDEEKALSDNDVMKKGETSANGRDLEDSIGKLYDEMMTIKRIQIPIATTKIDMITSSITYIEPIPIPPTMPTSQTRSTTVTSSPIGEISVLPKVTTIAKTISSMTGITGTTTNIVRRAKFSPPPPPPRRLLLTQSELTTIQQVQARKDEQAVEISGNIADICCSLGVQNSIKPINLINNRKAGANNIENSVENTEAVVDRQSIPMRTKSHKIILPLCQSATFLTTTTTVTTMKASTTTVTSVMTIAMPIKTTMTTTTTTTATATSGGTLSVSPLRTGAVPGSGLSPRLEMRLALNHDIMGDEDLISYDPGPDLTTILGHDLSTFHRLTGRDLLSRSANRIQPKEPVISYSQQRNSKMDTPTLNRKRQQQQLQQQQQQNRNIWNNSAYVDQIVDGDINDENYRNNNNSSGETKLGDLELLAKREKIYCTSRLKSGSPAKAMMTTITTTPSQMTPMMKNTSSMGLGIDTMSVCSSSGSSRGRIKYEHDGILPLSDNKATDSRRSRFFNFLTRRNSENQLTQIFRNSLDGSNASSPRDRRIFSPRKDNDKPPLNRRFWKQLTKRRRAHSVSEIAAS